MTKDERRERDKAIIAAVHAGETGKEVGKRYGISDSRVSYILKAHNARLPKEERTRRAAERVRHLKSPGRPRLYADDPKKRHDYLSLRELYGAALAKDIIEGKAEK